MDARALPWTYERFLHVQQPDCNHDCNVDGRKRKRNNNMNTKMRKERARSTRQKKSAAQHSTTSTRQKSVRSHQGQGPAAEHSTILTHSPSLSSAPPPHPPVSNARETAASTWLPLCWCRSAIVPRGAKLTLPKAEEFSVLCTLYWGTARF